MAVVVMSMGERGEGSIHTYIHTYIHAYIYNRVHIYTLPLCFTGLRQRKNGCHGASKRRSGIYRFCMLSWLLDGVEPVRYAARLQPTTNILYSTYKVVPHPIVQHILLSVKTKCGKNCSYHIIIITYM